jgi:probable rRNA maturation factor
MKKLEILGDDVPARLPLPKSVLKAYARSVLQECHVPQYTINIIFIEDRFMAALNAEYRQRQGTTDVLSFTLSEQGAAILEGEIYISHQQMARQAEELDVSPGEETIRLITHGLLHLAGRTHDTEEDYQSYMDETERLIRLYYRGGERG